MTATIGYSLLNTRYSSGLGKAVNKSRARGGKRPAMRRQRMALQKVSSEREALRHLLLPAAALADEKAGQDQQTVAERFACRERDRPPGPGRDIGEILLAAGGSTS